METMRKMGKQTKCERALIRINGVSIHFFSLAKNQGFLPYMYMNCLFWAVWLLFERGHNFQELHSPAIHVSSHQQNSEKYDSNEEDDC